MLDDFKFAWRQLRHAPGFTAIAVLTLALAIGANTAIFSITDAVLFRPLPYTDPDRVYVLQMSNRDTGQRFLLTPYEYLQAIGEYHSGLGEVGILESAADLIVSTADEAESIPTARATASYFQVLGIRPARGRLFDAADEAQPGGAAVLTYAAWRQRFGGDEQLIGTPVTLGTTTVDVVGVLPAGFVFPSPSAGKPEIITVMQSPVGTGGTFHPVVRLEPGVTREQAQTEMETLVAPMAARSSSTANQTPVLNEVRSVLYPMGQPIMIFLQAAAMLVLLIGCANLAGLLLARSKIREREIGVRAALGAGSLRLVRPLIFEAVLIGLAGALLAVLVTVLTFDALLVMVPPIAYGNAPVGVDRRVVLFALGLGLFAGLSFSVVPAWRATRLDALALIQGRQNRRPSSGRLWRGGSHGYIGSPMIAIQVALALVLVFAAIIAARAFVSILRVPIGFTPEQVITVRLRPNGLQGADLQAFYIRAMETVAQRSDILSAGASGSLPLGSSMANEGARAVGATQMSAGIIHVLPGYFETVGIALLRGRLLNWDDVSNGAGAAVISDSAARSLFPGREPLGATFDNGRDRPFTVVGVVADVRGSLDRDSEPPAYVIPAQATRFLTLVFRTTARQEATLAQIRREVSALAPGAPVTAQWWADSISNLTAYRNPRFQTLVLSAFAMLALGLTALGIFGAVAFWVATRTHEMGVRVALGATPRALVGLMIRQALTPVASGILIGLAATRWAGRLAEAQLFRVETRDPWMLAATAATVLAVALLAAYLPSRRASRIDPMVILREE